MSALKPAEDPYRILGVPRGADDRQIRAAHRRLVKRHHPDATGGQTDRFLAIQEAYQLLIDPLRRREWDRRHAPVASDARARPPRPPRATSRRPDGHPDDSARSARKDPGRTSQARYEPRSGPRPEPEPSPTGSGAEPGPSPTGSGRHPGTRSHTWTADGVPWWEEFAPKQRQGRQSGDKPPATVPRPDGDVYNRSSGAAWSMAARQHFRRRDADLPTGGAFRYRGTQVVTGAEARKVAAEEAAGAAEPRQAPTGPPPPPALRRRGFAAGVGALLDRMTRRSGEPTRGPDRPTRGSDGS